MNLVDENLEEELRAEEAWVRASVFKWLQATGFLVDEGLQGCTPAGLACFIQARAPRQHRRINRKERDFLVERISKGSFGAVVDSVEILEKTWREFQNLHHMAPHYAKAFLLKELPAPQKF